MLNIDRSSLQYRIIRPDDADLRKAMKEVAAERRRFGYRRIHVMLERQGIHMNQKKLRRLYREEGLQVRKRGGRKRALGTRRQMVIPETINQRWSLDFVSDTSLSGARLTRELDAIIQVRGMPTTLVSDNGTEMTSSAVLEWCQKTKVDWHYIAPGKPTQNAFI